MCTVIIIGAFLLRKKKYIFVRVFQKHLTTQRESIETFKRTVEILSSQSLNVSHDTCKTISECVVMLLVPATDVN